MKRVVFIGQAPARPESKHEVAGTYVRPWLYRIGLDEETIERQCRFYALIDYFPGSNGHGHLRPTPQQIAEHRSALITVLQEFTPDIVVLVGAMAIVEVMPDIKGKLSDLIGNRFEVDPFKSLGKPITVIPLPHPSGRSIWLNQHSQQLDKALRLLQGSLI